MLRQIQYMEHNTAEKSGMQTHHKSTRGIPNAFGNNVAHKQEKSP